MSSSDKVRAKKHLGQHFLNDESVAKNIANTLTLNGYNKVLEIGPGMGVLTKYLLQKPIETFVIEIDTESVAYLEKHYPKLHNHIIGEDFLKYNLKKIFQDEPYAIIGNFPYNISTQIVFRVLEMRDQIPEFSGMFQKEVAERICEKSEVKPAESYLPLVSGVLRYRIPVYRSQNTFAATTTRITVEVVMRIDSKRKIFSFTLQRKAVFTVVKSAFNQRRKTMRNSLKEFIADEIKENEVFNLRPEQLNVEEFIALTQKIEAYGIQNQ